MQLRMDTTGLQGSDKWKDSIMMLRLVHGPTAVMVKAKDEVRTKAVTAQGPQ